MGLFRPKEDTALPVGSDLMDLAAIAGCDKQVAMAVKGKRPDVLRFGIVESVELAIGFDSKNLAVGSRRGIDPIALIDSDRLNLKTREFRDNT